MLRYVHIALVDATIDARCPPKAKPLYPTPLPLNPTFLQNQYGAVTCLKPYKTFMRSVAYPR